MTNEIQLGSIITGPTVGFNTVSKGEFTEMFYTEKLPNKIDGLRKEVTVKQHALTELKETAIANNDIIGNIESIEQDDKIGITFKTNQLQKTA